MANVTGIRSKTTFFDTYSLNRIFSIFLACAFPIHLWSLLMVLQDVGWVADRTRVADAFSYVAYSLVFALMESLVVFLIVMLLSLLAYSRWKHGKMAAAIISLYYVTVLWAMAVQVYYYVKGFIPELDAVIVYKFYIGSPIITQILILVLLFIIVVGSVVIPLYLLQRWDRYSYGMNEAISRVAVLTSVYLVVDLFGLFLIFARNVYRTQFWDFFNRLRY